MRSRFIPLCVVLAACTGSPYYHREYDPVSGASSASRTDLQSAAVAAVTDRGLTVENNDREAGIVTTTWECGMNCETRYRLRIAVRDGGFEIAINCQRESAESMMTEKEGTDRGYQNCNNEDTRPQMWLDHMVAVSQELEGP